MIRSFSNHFSSHLYERYHKTLARLEKGLESGRFAAYSKQKKTQIWSRLKRYARQLGIALKPGLITACMGAGLFFANNLSAQSFVEKTGTANPLDGISHGYYSFPTFVDIDGDGDQDLFIGSSLDSATIPIVYYKNIGTATAPIFAQQIGNANPFDNVIRMVGIAVPDFADIDGDGDQDAFIWQGDTTFLAYYKNVGTVSAPAFVEQVGAANPLNGINTEYHFFPALADIDGDGDIDISIAGYYGTVKYYRNTGTATSPIFTEQMGAANPFDGFALGYMTPITIADIDGDGDKDLLGAEYYGTLTYYKNTGTPTSPIFMEQTGSANPFDSVDIGDFPTPTCVDIDGDGDQDVFIGEYGAGINYYRNEKISTSFVEPKYTTFRTYPNPTSSVLNLEISGNNIETTNLLLYNIWGQVVFEKEIKAPYNKVKEEIDMSSFPAGIYSLSFGKKVLKVVKE